MAGLDPAIDRRTVLDEMAGKPSHDVKEVNVNHYLYNF
jgi:hypothetical protein